MLVGDLFAEDLPYWKTSQSSPDTWTERAINLIENFGGKLLNEAFGKDQDGHAAYLLIFEIGKDHFKIVWPVVRTKTGANDRAARVQAVTMMYHDIEAKLVTAEIFGSRAALFQYWMLPDGRTTAEASIPELAKGIPILFDKIALQSGGAIDAEYSEE